MTHPDSYLVGPLGLGMVAVGWVAAFVLAIFIGSRIERVRPVRRSRLPCWGGLAVLFPVAAFVLSSYAFKALAVIASFGQDAYAGGLRVVNEHGQLSDGTFLGVFWAAVIGVGPVLVMIFSTVPLLVWYKHFHRRQVPEPTPAS